MENLRKLGRDESTHSRYNVLRLLGCIKGGAKQVNEGSLLVRTSSTDLKGPPYTKFSLRTNGHKQNRESTEGYSRSKVQ